MLGFQYQNKVDFKEKNERSSILLCLKEYSVVVLVYIISKQTEKNDSDNR
jgi:hypothetical protein